MTRILTKISSRVIELENQEHNCVKLTQKSTSKIDKLNNDKTNKFNNLSLNKNLNKKNVFIGKDLFFYQNNIHYSSKNIKKYNFLLY